MIVLLPLLITLLLIGIFDTGSPVFVQVRVGKNERPFKLLKFRTMRLDTESFATHLIPERAITKYGRLRRTKLDELPQLWNVLLGDMSMVGPRPSLFNQHDLIAARKLLGVSSSKPGITGLAQINKIDMSQPRLLAKADLEMTQSMSIRMYFSIIIRTILRI